MAQTEGGAISRSQCVLTGQTPANLVSLRGAVDLGVGFYWESADNPAFTGPSLVSPFSPNAQTFAMGAHTVTTYYRRVVPTGLGSPFAYYSNTVKITIVGVTNAPSFIPTGVSPICQGNTSFTVSFLLSNSPTKYSIIWSTVPSGLGFADVLEQNLPGSSPLTVIVPASAPLGTYAGTLIPLDANGCSTSSAPASFTFNALPSVNSIAGSNAVCIGSTIPLTNTTIGGVWSSGTNATISNTGVLTGVSAGATLVSYTVTDGNGCTNAATSLKTINPLPNVNAITGSSSLCVGSTSSLTNTTPGGVWSSGTPANGTINSTGVLTGVSAGTTVVSYTVTNVNGCVNAATSLKTINPLPIVNAITGSSSLCVGSTSSLANTTPGGVWSSGTIAIGTINSTGVLTGVSAGATLVSYAVTDVNGCTNTATSLKTINALPTVNAITGSNAVCMGATINLSNTTSGGVWSSGTTANATINATGVLTGVSAGTTLVSYTVTDGNGCTNAATSLKTINPLPIVNAITGSSSLCVGSTSSLTNTTIGGVWSSGTIANATISNTGVLTGVSAGTTVVSYTVTNVNGCVNAATSLKTINPLPTVTTITGNNAVCIGSTITLANSTTQGVWSSVPTSTATINATGVLTGISAGTTTVSYTVTDNNGCTNLTTSIKTINAIPVVNAITGNNAVCVGSTITLANSTAGGTWTSGTLANGTISTSGVLAGISVGTTTISYVVTDVNGCTGSVSSSKTVNPLPAITITNPATACNPATINLLAPAITAGSSTGTIFSYWKDASTTNPLITPGAVAVSGTYYIKGTLSSTGCSNTQPVIVNILAQPTININNPAAVCEPVTIDLTAAAITNGSTAGLTYSYFTDATNTIAVSTPTAISVSGTYYVKGSLASGCTASLPVTVTINPLPNGSLQTPAVNYICDGIPFVLNATNAFAYQWYADQKIISGETAATYAVTKPGNYTVQFVSKEGCVKNASNSIPLNLLVKPTLQFKPNGLCISSPISFSNTSTVLSSGGINWLWDFGDGASSNNSTPTHTYLQAGVYTISLTANNISCVSLTEKMTTIYTLEAPKAALRYDTILAVNGKSFILNARPIGSGYVWKPATGLNSSTVRSPTANLSTEISYTISITNAAGCVTTDTVFVKLSTSGEIYVAQGFSPNGDGVNDLAYPILKGMRQLVYFKIFNRWGNLVYQTNDETPQNGWDGKYQGKIQPSGTYTWIAEAVDGNGNAIRKNGNLLLIN